MNIIQNILECYDSNEQERMISVMRAIDNGRLIYIRFNPDGSGTSFYYRSTFSNKGGCQFALEAFDEEQSKIILMGCVIERDSFNKQKK